MRFENELQQRTLAKLVRRAHDLSDTGQTDLIILAAQKHRVLAEEFSWLLKPIELGSREAKQLKARYLKEQKWKEDRDKRPLLDPPPTERILQCLDECESGDQSAFWKLNLEMTLEPQDRYYGDELEPDLIKLPGWKDAEDITRKRIIQAARRYIVSGDPETPRWLGNQESAPTCICRLSSLSSIEESRFRFLAQAPTGNLE